MKILTLLCLISLLFVRILCDKQLTLVVDTTATMAEEINILRTGLRRLLSSENLNFQKYTLITINDPYVSKPLEFPFTRETFFRHLERLIANSDEGCIRNTADGIGVALEHSTPGSTVYVVTDALTRKSTRDITSACKIKNVKVEIILTGICGKPFNYQPSDVEIYTEIAKACSGQLFKLEPMQIYYIFEYLLKTQQDDWSQVTSQEIEGYQNVTITIESSETILCILAYGNNPNIENVKNILLLENLTPIMTTRYVMIYRTTNPISTPLVIKTNMGSQGTTVITTLHKFKPVFEIRFAPRLITDYQSMDNTILRQVSSFLPVPGHRNVILLLTNEGCEFDSILLSSRKRNETLKLEKVNRAIYTTSAFFDPYVSFNMKVTGHYGSQREFSENIYNLRPQDTKLERAKRTEVKLFPPKNTTILYGSNLTLICSVKGYPEPVIWWENDRGDTFFPQQYYLHTKYEQLSYLDITHISEEMTVTCKGKNDASSGYGTLILTVYRPKMLEIVEGPEDTIIEYGETGELKCIVNGYPEPEIQWYQNDTVIDFENSDNYVKDKHRLLIRNMTINDIGLYQCVASNELKTEKRTADIKISGIESPEINLENEIILQVGENRTIECSLLKGSPKPNIIWSYKSSDDFNEELPNDVDIENDQLIITEAGKIHSGMYKCNAENFVGQDSKEFSLRVHYPPTIERNNVENITVSQGETVQLECEVDAEPSANVVWNRNGAVVSFDDRHSLDENETLRFVALLTDEGFYSCVAENELGVARKTVFVKVLVCPKIETPPSDHLLKRMGESLYLACNAIEGNPAPMITWGFIPKNPADGYKVLTSGTRNSIVNIPSLTKRHEGIYQCIADNEFDKDRIRIKVDVI